MVDGWIGGEKVAGGRIAGSVGCVELKPGPLVREGDEMWNEIGARWNLWVWCRTQIENNSG